MYIELDVNYCDIHEEWMSVIKEEKRRKGTKTTYYECALCRELYNKVERLMDEDHRFPEWFYEDEDE